MAGRAPSTWVGDWKRAAATALPSPAPIRGHCCPNTLVWMRTGRTMSTTLSGTLPAAALPPHCARASTARDPSRAWAMQPGFS